MKHTLLRIFLLMFTSLQHSVEVEAQNITTIAGTGVAGYAGDGSNAIVAQFDHPDVLKFDKLGNMYIADEHNHVVRKINTSGIITTIAGTGYGAGTLSGDYTGDGAPATNARLSRPMDLAFDGVGNLYIAELGNGTIRKVTPTGIITTIAGTGVTGYNGDNIPATSAKLYGPFGLVFDNAGNLYFADNGNRRVRKINSAGIITTIAGTGVPGYIGDGGPATAAQIKVGGYLSFDASGNLFIADYFNHVIRKVDAAGIITTVAGNGINGNDGDGGPATSASIANMWGILFDPSGNMYLSDRLIPVIRKVNTAGIITTIAGKGTLAYSGDGGPATAAELNWDVFCSAIDAAGNLYIADPNNNRIRKITYSSMSVNDVNKTTQNITIYPNPATNELTISSTEKIESIAITNLMGQEVYEQIYSRNKVEIDISSFANGIYFVKVNGVYGGRFVKE